MHGRFWEPAVMNCQDARESLSTLLDGDIGLTDRVPIELHVNACAECQKTLADLQALRLLPDKPAARPVHQWHWPPVFAADAVGRAFGFMRQDDVVTRMRRLLIGRIPPRHLAIAAAVPLAAIVAIFVFERGFKVGTAMRQRGTSPPAVVTQGPPAPASPRAVVVDPVTPPAAAPPALLPRPAVAPQAPTPPADTPKTVRAPAPETNAPEARSATRGTPADAGANPTKSAASPATAPVKASLPAATQDGTSRPVAAALAASAMTRSSMDVIGRLRVKSRSEAERDLGALVTRAGGTFVSRQRGPTTTVVEARVPHAAYGTFARGMARMGAWQLEAERSPLPDLVHVTVRLAE